MVNKENVAPSTSSSPQYNATSRNVMDRQLITWSVYPESSQVRAPFESAWARSLHRFYAANAQYTRRQCWSGPRMTDPRFVRQSLIATESGPCAGTYIP